MGHGLHQIRKGLFTQVRSRPIVVVIVEGEKMSKLHPCRKFCYLLFMLSVLSISYAQETTRKVVKKVPVPYPQALKDKGIQGAVRLKVLIKSDGSVKDTELLGGNPILAESAQKSVSQWKFAPANSDSSVEIVVHFDPAAKTEN